MDSLVRQGLLVLKGGVGTQVVSGPVRRSVQLTSLHEDLSEIGHAPATVFTSFSRVSGQADLAKALQLPPEDPACHFTRIRLASGRPLALMGNYVHGPMEILASEALATNSLDILRRAGANLRVASQSMGPPPRTVNRPPC